MKALLVALLLAPTLLSAALLPPMPAPTQESASVVWAQKDAPTCDLVPAGLPLGSATADQALATTATRHPWLTAAQVASARDHFEKGRCVVPVEGLHAHRDPRTGALHLGGGSIVADHYLSSEEETLNIGVQPQGASDTAALRLGQRVGDPTVPVHQLAAFAAGGPGSDDPVNVIFYALPAGADAAAEIEVLLTAAGWEDTSECTSAKYVTMLDSTHGGTDTSRRHDAGYQPEVDQCFNPADARDHLRTWASATGNTHIDGFSGGYVIAAAHREKVVCEPWYECPPVCNLCWWAWKHEVTSFDEARDRVVSDFVSAGLVQYALWAEFGNTADPDGDGWVAYLPIKEPTLPCSGAPVQLFKDRGPAGACFGFEVSDDTFDNNAFDDGSATNDHVSALVVAAGLRVTLYEHIGFGGGSQTYTGPTSVSFVGEDWNDTFSSIEVKDVDVSVLAHLLDAR